VIGTALIEGVLAWVGFAIACVPGAVLLAGLTFFFAVIQIGPLVVWLPVAIWLGFQGQTGWAIFVAIWGIVLLMGADNIVKPVLISRSGQLPTLVLFVGVMGGLAAWASPACSSARRWPSCGRWCRLGLHDQRSIGL
jgi:predicted PurR-regulated permease PerM